MQRFTKSLPALQRLPSSSVCRRCAYATSAEGSTDASAPSAKAGPSRPSIMPAGTVMKGLSIYKDQPDPVALPDSEYPSWLWDIAGEVEAPVGKKGAVRTEMKVGKEEPAGFDFKTERRKLRANNKESIKGSNLLKGT